MQVAPELQDELEDARADVELLHYWATKNYEHPENPSDCEICLAQERLHAHLSHLADRVSRLKEIVRELKEDE